MIVENMTSNQILSCKKCGDLFTNNPNTAKEEYKKLVKIWHPDNLKKENKKNGEEVFKKINYLYSLAEKLFSQNTWEQSNKIYLKDNKNNKYFMTYLKSYDTEFGKSYINNNTLIFSFSKEKEKYYNLYLKNLKNLKYENKEMKEEFERFLPSLKNENLRTKDDFCVVLNKIEDVYSLNDIYEYFNKKIEHRHVAWTMSRLLNILCFFEYNKIAHNGIDLDTCYISPKYHSIMIYGGWQYAQKIGEKMIGTKKEIYEIMPVSNKNKKISNISTDIESVKLIGRKLLGSRSGSKLSDEIPEPFRNWLNDISSNSAFEEFKIWSDVLIKSYGRRRFVAMEVDKNKIYN